MPNAAGRLSYVRRIPADLRPFLGGRSVIRRSLGVTGVDQGDPVVVKRWNAVHQEVEAEISAARATKTAGSAPAVEVTGLSPRDIAGIGAEPLRQLLDAGDQGRITQEIANKLATVGGKAMAGLLNLLRSGDIAGAERMKADISEELLAETLNQLQMKPDERQMQQIVQRLMGYVGDLSADIEAREEGDFNSSQLKDKAPDLPKRKLTWEDLLEQYRISVGGTTESEGIGVSQDRIAQYQLAIREICESSQRYFPDELTQDDARRYVNELQQGSRSVNTQRKRLDALKNLYAIGIQYGLLESNPFQNLRIKVPRGTEEKTYRPFTRDELAKICKVVQAMPRIDRRWVIDALICTGARAGEIIKLRTTDIKKTEDGIWYFDFKHDPIGEYPTTLKGAQQGERKTPLHPLLIERGYLDYVQRKADGYIINLSTDTSAWSIWFKKYVLEPTDIYEENSTGLHSIRNSSIDIWRASGVSAEVRRALVAHAAQDVQDKIYGEGLQNMPEVLLKELKKVDLSWLP